MKREKKGSQSELPAPLAQFALALKKHGQDWTALIEEFNGCMLAGGNGTIVPDPFRLERVLRRLTTELAGPPAVPVELKEWIVAEKSRVAARFEQDLREFCQPNHLQVDGRYPSYVIGEGISIEVQATEGVTLIDDLKIPSLMFQAVRETLEEAVAEAVGDFSAEKFLSELAEASRRAARLDDAMSLDGMPVRAVFRELVFVKQQSAFFKNPIRSNYSEYTLRSFARDLTRLMRSGVTTTNGKRLNLGPTSTADGVTIRYEGAARKIGRIGFVEGDR